MKWIMPSEDGERAINIWKCDKCGTIVKYSAIPNGWTLIRQEFGIKIDLCLECSTIVINHVLSLIADVKFEDD